MASKAKKAQPTISAYFSQPASATPPAPKGKRVAPIDLTISDEEDVAPTPKRSKLSDGINRASAPATGTLKGPFATPRKSRTAKVSTRPLLESPVSKYVYQASPTRDSNQADDEEMLSPEEVQARDARREAFRRKLGSQFERKDNNALQIAEGDQSYEIDGGERAPPSSENDEDSDVQEVEPTVISKKLSAFAATSSKGASGSKPKATSSKPPVKARTKKVDEIGPSGLKYTPLEKQVWPVFLPAFHGLKRVQQVAACKKDNPDCLLLFEVGYKYRFFGTDAQVGISTFPSLAHPLTLHPCCSGRI